MSKLQTLNPEEELQQLRSRRKRENRLETMGFTKRERTVFAKEEWGPWFDDLVKERLKIRRKAILNAWDRTQYQDAIRAWYKKHKWLEPATRLHGKHPTLPWKALAYYQAKWREANPNEPTSPKAPTLTSKQIDYHEEWFRKRYKERHK